MKKLPVFQLLAAGIAMCVAGSVSADLSCIKVSSKNGRIRTAVRVVSGTVCPRGFTKVVDTSSLVGPAGANGSAGLDGQRLIFGGAVGGARQISSTSTLEDSILEYSSFTVDSGVTLTVPSGTVIRTTGAFTNNGTITVSRGARGAIRGANGSGEVIPRLTSAHPGISLRAAGDSALGDNSTTRLGGRRGEGLSAFQARQIRYPGSAAGGGGGNADNSASSESGGGSLVVLAQGEILNAGIITANGTGGDGGGSAGGVVILASKTSITNSISGSIAVNGGNGENSDIDQAASGGGGGGFIHFISPIVTNSGQVTALAGAAGVSGASGSVTNLTLRGGGGGGGACAGSGGDGGSISASGELAPPTPAEDGFVLTSLIDPTASF